MDDEKDTLQFDQREDQNHLLEKMFLLVLRLENQRNGLQDL
jgi:hypothetical protein